MATAYDIAMSTRVDNLLARVVRRRASIDEATLEVLRAAMRAAIDVTHECGTPEYTDAAVLVTFRGMGRHLAHAAIEASACPEACGPACPRCYPDT